MSFAIVCFCALIGTQSAQSPAPPTDAATSDEYAIYSAVLNESFADGKIHHIVIGDHTMMAFPPIMMGMSGFGDTLKKIRETAAKDTLADYDRKNKTAIPLQNRFSTRVPVVLISESERDEIFEIKGQADKKTANPAGMKELQRRYPNSQGFMNLSRIGLDKNAIQALIYAGNICGGLCGSGQVFFLRKEGGAWKVKLSATTWVS
jgi:hypothetical protein